MYSSNVSRLSDNREIGVFSHSADSEIIRNPYAIHEAKFYEKSCRNYCCGYFGIVGFLLLISFAILIFVPPLGLLLAAITPGSVILYLAKKYYADQVTTGQIIGNVIQSLAFSFPPSCVCALPAPQCDSALHPLRGDPCVALGPAPTAADT